MAKLLAGINLAMQTPFNADGSINFNSFEALIDQYIDAGVHGLVLGAGTGQHPYLTEAECNKLYEVGVKRINGRCNIICQTSALIVDEVIRRSKHAEAIGADAIMVLPPYFEGPADDDGLLAFYEDVDSAIKVDIVGYNIPQSTGISVSTSLLKRLAQLPNFKYIKDSGGDLVTHQEYLQTNVNVLNGADPIAPYAFMAGAVGTIWGAANFMPKEAVALYNLVQEQKITEALQLWKKMLPSILYVWRNNYLPSVVHAAHLRGFGTGNVRRPLRKLNAEEEKALKEALAPLLG
ncbi:MULTISPECIES: dihydrodipicolinate synthase family protein [unclassified Burkholderia]|uniref:dihydrodipicolinate synthase family protein n=1 Tax=unclassified Burkholderia TaxID=2613784 RepID=UPI000F5821A4|nr:MULTISPECIES: dihydrodipicolinate synthase family protein [unclassified Burkholderia]RQR41268.1 dihydrodipicolinate synthase family protein [Burkholderia sp. Bp9142]RQR52789.1 dihydrodipicolinate synthase family protein [Burkholderia sp. Bp9140]